MIPEVDPSFAKQMEATIAPTQKAKRKKREIRVFVSSTFRDFKAEREELIKKTFREVTQNILPLHRFYIVTLMYM